MNRKGHKDYITLKRRNDIMCKSILTILLCEMESIEYKYALHESESTN